jgi:acyl carrier protein
MISSIAPQLRGRQPDRKRKLVSSEDEFVTAALQFLEEIGADTAQVEVEVNLFESGVLDSLATLAFLDFLEQRRGREIEIDKLNIEEISTLGKAYKFAHAHEEAEVDHSDELAGRPT